MTDLFTSEQLRAARIAKMSDAEIEAALLNMPASPTEDEDVLERAGLRRCQLERRNTAALQATQVPPASPATIEVVIPPELGATSIQSVDRRRFFHPRPRADGSWVVDMPVPTFLSIARATKSNTDGASPGRWFEVNPTLVEQLLDKREVPPIVIEEPLQPAPLSW